MPSLMNLALADSFVADAERRWLYGHPYRGELRPRRVRAAARRIARARRPVAARRGLRTA